MLLQVEPINLTITHELVINKVTIKNVFIYHKCNQSFSFLSAVSLVASPIWPLPPEMWAPPATRSICLYSAPFLISISSKKAKVSFGFYNCMKTSHKYFLLSRTKLYTFLKP